jgi:hypothetical protein
MFQVFGTCHCYAVHLSFSGKAFTIGVRSLVNSRDPFQKVAFSTSETHPAQSLIPDSENITSLHCQLHRRRVHHLAPSPSILFLVNDMPEDCFSPVCQNGFAKAASENTDNPARAGANQWVDACFDINFRPLSRSSPDLETQGFRASRLVHLLGFCTLSCIMVRTTISCLCVEHTDRRSQNAGVVTLLSYHQCSTCTQSSAWRYRPTQR